MVLERFFLAIFCLGLALPASAQNTVRPPKTAFAVFDVFSGQSSPRDHFAGEVVHLPNEVERDTEGSVQKEEPAAEEEIAKQVAAPLEEEVDESLAQEAERLPYVTDDPAKHIQPPDEDPKVRVNPEAPPPFLAMVKSYRDGDLTTANSYADQYVRYMVNLMFEVREFTKMIGAALIRNEVIDEEDWVGVEQYLDLQFALSRKDNGTPLKPTHSEAMKRIIGDPDNKAEIYYFFTMSCSWCRHMASDIERLWIMAEADPRLKMAAFTLGPVHQPVLASYREYTGLSMPVLDGKQVAKSFNVGFVPAIVVVSPKNNKAYVKTGYQSFERLYEFIRTVQGLPATVSPNVMKIVQTPIGMRERFLKKQGEFKPELKTLEVARREPARKLKVSQKQTLGRF